MTSASQSYNKYSDVYMQHQGSTKIMKLCRINFVVPACSVFLVVAIIVLVVASTVLGNKHWHVSRSRLLQSGSTDTQSICISTLYPQLCAQSFSSYLASSRPSNPMQPVITASQLALTKVNVSFILAKKLSFEPGNGLENVASQDCVELMGDALFQINNCISLLSGLGVTSPQEQSISNMKILFSTALSYQTACTDGFSDQVGSVTNQMLSNQEDVSKVIINALDVLELVSKLGSSELHYKISAPDHSRRLLFHQLMNSFDGDRDKAFSPKDYTINEYPDWLSTADRKLLQATSPIKVYNVSVAKDGSGAFTTIQDAIDNIPNGYGGRYVIYIKEGVYHEIVNISNNYQNITFWGDGINKTFITGSRNVASGLYTTFRTATVAVSGQGFMAKHITFQNKAGPGGHQAVAFRAGADYVALDSCRFEGYQDTLYALSSRQFYRNCKIYGTVDFIFGNAAAVFQNCELSARQPLPGQQNTYTAQGRTVAVDPTGYSFQNCTVTAADDLKASNFTVMTYLGRPWKAYSRTVFLESYLDSVVDPAGWLAWNSSNPYEDTLYYGEYNNRGPGSGTSKRVNWTGVHSHMSYQDAVQFSVTNFISGTSWLPQENVGFDASI